MVAGMEAEDQVTKVMDLGWHCVLNWLKNTVEPRTPRPGGSGEMMNAAPADEGVRRSTSGIEAKLVS
jgi:hypothetical protein